MRLRLAAVLVAQSLCVAAVLGGDITSGSLEIQGISLEVDTPAVTTGIEIPTTVQTKFAGKINEAAPRVEGLLAVGELTGPGLDTPIQLTTAPGYKFQIPGFTTEGIYYLQNVRLMKGTDFVAPASPSAAAITVANVLQTSVKVRQLSPVELRSRGIVVDGRNFNVYEYSFTFLVNGQAIEIPFPVIIDPRTHEVTPIVHETSFNLPSVGQTQPPRWSPPDVVAFELPPDDEGQGDTQPATNPGDQKPAVKRASIPAAIVIPNSLAVLHQFFAVILTVSNGAPSGSTARLDDIRATIKVPAALRTAKTNPTVAFGQAVPIVDPTTGVTFLVAQSKGEAEWDLEGLQPGTHTVEIEVRATLRENGQADVPLKATPRASIVVQDPRFNITFSHPDTIRKGIDYSTYSFITNLSGGAQTIRVTNGVPSCDQAAGANVCRIGGADSDEMTLASGEMKMVEYKLRPGITGHVFATAGTIGDSGAISAAVQLSMGVSETGIPLSPTTLVMPYYAQFLSPALIDANLQLLGLGYSLATAPVNQTTAKFPRVIRSDVFYRALDLARAGQRVFITDGNAGAKLDALSNLTLDLLGNGVQLDEWDALRRSEKSGRIAGAAVVRELNSAGMTVSTSISDFADRFASATSYRTPYLMAIAHGPTVSGNDTPYVVALRGTSGRVAAVTNEADSGWIRELSFGDVSRFDAAALNESGEIAIAGRWTEDLEIDVTPAVSGPVALEIVFPAAGDGALLRAHLVVNGTAGETLRVPLTRGAASIAALAPNGGINASASSAAVVPIALQAVAARQDLNLDREGHKVSVLFNRPVALQDGGDWLTHFAASIAFNRDGVVYNGNRSIFAAALQDDQRIVNLSFDGVLTTNASYSISIDPVVDPLTGSEAAFAQPLQPKIDNDRPAGIVYGKFLKGDNTPIGAAEVRLYTGHFRGCQVGLLDDDPPLDCNPYLEAPQYVKSEADGTYLFESIPRDPIADAALTGGYRLLGVSSEGKFTIVDGAVRLPGRVSFVNLQLLGRGAAEGVVRYENGQTVAGASVFAGSTMFNIGRRATSDASGFFHVDDLPVGPITFTATDAAGNVAYASGEIATPGQLISKQLQIIRKANPGTATVFGVVLRSDTSAPVVAARVGVYSQGYGLSETLTDSAGRFEFQRVPAGFVTVLAAEWSVSRQSAALDFDLHADETREANLTLSVAAPNDATASLSGDVLRENPLFPGDPSKYERVAGAIVKLAGRPVTADSNGHFTFDSLPVAWNTANLTISAYDPSTRRIGSMQMPTLTEAGPNNVSIFIPANSFGTGTIRVRLLSAQGQPVSGFRVFEPGYPPTEFRSLGAGLYDLSGAVGGNVDIWAVSTGGAFGEQFAHDSARLEFPGQIATVTMRLPGQGTVRVKLHGDFDVIGDVSIGYLVWDEAEQTPRPKFPAPTASTSENGVAGYATFTNVPALESYKVESNHPSYGYASASGTLAYDGDVGTHTLQLAKLASIRGTVYAIDGRTPIAGAAVRLDDGSRDTGVTYSQPDGTFVYTDVPPDARFSVVADSTQSGIYRTGVAYGKTPPAGGPVDGVSVVLQRRGSIDGRVVYIGYKTYDPNNPANNVADDTPDDLSDNAPVPLAKLWLKELDFPRRTFGSDAEPLTADIAGRFALSSVFVGRLRARAWDSGNQELRGDWNGSIDEEGQPVTAYIGIGSGGTGSVQVTIADPNQSNAPVINAEVGLYRSGGIFDLTSSDGNGVATFAQVPIGSYSINAYSKALGKSGTSTAFTVDQNLVTQLRVLLEFSGNVDGSFTDPEAAAPNGIAGAAVTLTGAGYQARASTGTLGAFAFDGVREGLFTLTAKDTQSNRRATASHTLSAADPHPTVNLQLEPTATLYLSVYLPDDTGAISSVLAGPVSVDVGQRFGDFARSMQGNPIVMPKLLAGEPYGIAVHEIGGEQRQLSFRGQFPKGSAADPVTLVYPAYGTVDVIVTQGGVPANGAKVTVSGGGRSATLFTDSTGRVTATGIGLGIVSAQAKSVDGGFSGSVSGQLLRSSVPAALAIELGAYAGVTGLVEAEAGGPSIGTRVVASFSGRALEVTTDPIGRYTFSGIPTAAGGTPVSLTYIGPDDVTIGGRQSVTLGTDAAAKVIELPSVRLDATPPRIVSISPSDGAQNVSPDSSIRIVFSEPILAGQVSNSYLQLVPGDGSGQVVAVFDPPVVAADGTFAVTMRPPPAPPGQRFPLKSNTLYRVIVSGAIEDRTGLRLPSPLGTTFTTTDYTEPHVIKTVPAITTPVPQQITFQFQFNEQVDPAPWQPGGGAVFHFYKLSAPGPAGAIVAEKPGHAYIDPATSLILNFAPNDPIEPESFYRVVFSGIRDLQGNALAEQTFHFFSFDNTKPFVRFVSPVPDGYPLVSGVEYLLGTDLRNATASGTPATDVAFVDYLRVDGTAETYLTTVRSAPFAYRFVAPDAPAGGMTYTLRAKATDGSGNVSDPATITWTVNPNAPPVNVTTTFTPPTAYPANSVVASVAFGDEGTFATVTVALAATRQDGTAFAASQTRQVTRATVADAWPAAQITFALPADLNPATSVAATTTVTDVRGLSTTATSALPLLTDSGKPSIAGVTPAPETTYHLNDKYTVVATATDAETAVASVDFTIDGQNYHVASTGSTTFTSPQITVPARNIDTRVSIVVTAKDYQGNSAMKSFEVVYIGVNDPTAPKGSWLCPIDRAVIPAAQTNFSLPLRVRATDDISVTGVQFRVPGITDPIAAARVGTTDDYTATATIPLTPDAGAAFTLTAIITDADPTHTIEVPIAIDIVAIDTIVDATQSIDAGNVSTFDSKSILVRTAAGRLVLHVPVTLRNLIVLDGGRVDTLGTTTTLEQRVDLTVIDRLYIDCASSIDVTARGYLGGWGANPDGSNTRNESQSGRTAGNSTAGGALGSGASHGGLGSITETGTPNAVYDSISDPVALGSGGSGWTDFTPGGTGGGAISIRTSSASDAIARIVIAGSFRADGGGGAGTLGAGSGGSIRLDARQVIAGSAAHITTNGGDSAPSSPLGTAGLAGGGGRIAVTASERLDVPAVLTQFESRGGDTPSSSRYLEAGAGTIYLRRPGQTDGELYIGSATATRPVRSTPIGETAAVTPVAFDRVEVGANALARFDQSVSVAGVVDDVTSIVKNTNAAVVLAGAQPAIAVTSTPAPGSNVIRGTNLDVSYDASSAAGISSVAVNFSAVSPINDAPPNNPAVVTARHVTVSAPSTATLGPATLNVHVADRADRTSDAPVLNFTVVDNAPPAIDSFTATPQSLYPGKSIAVSLAASDDVAVTKLSLTSPFAAQSITPNTGTATQTMTIVVPIATPGGTPMTIDAAAEDGYPGRAATTRSKSITILTDTAPPSVAITAPPANQQFNEGSGNTFVVTVDALDAEVGVRTVTVAVGGAPAVSLSPAATANQWQGSVAVPNVDGIDPVAIPLVVNASDYAGNTSSAATTILVKPLIDPNAPSLSWTCATDGAMYPAGYATPLRVYAKGVVVNGTLNGVQKVEFFANGSATPILAAPVAGVADQYEAPYTIPSLADGIVIPIRAVATSVSGAASDLTTHITVVATGIVTVSSDTVLDAANASSYDGKTVVVQSGTLTVTGAHTFDRLLLLNTGTLTHSAGGGTKLDVTTTRGTFIACGAAIDVSGRGYAPNQSYPGAGLPGNSNAGSHLGVGAIWSAPPGGATFGSVDRPRESGGGGESTSATAGGGIVRIIAATVVDDGAVRGNGASSSSTNSRGGAGGSIWITTSGMSGAGVVEAKGGAADLTGGGGGAIALETTGPASSFTNVSAGSGASLKGHFGGAGTIFVRTTSSIYGSVTVDNEGHTGAATDLPALGRGFAQGGSSGATLVTDRAADIPSYFAGHWVDITDASGVQKGRWRIASINARSVTLAPNGAETISIVPGDRWQGFYQFDALKLRNTRLTSEDRLMLGVAADLDGSSSILGNNVAAPVLDPAKITLQASPAGASVVGSAGAVADSDTPITMIATNTRTSTITTSPAGPDGSFAVSVQGTAGDTITLKARDGNFYPLESVTITAGTLSETTQAPASLSQTAWTTDTSFKSQRLALEGTILAVSNTANFSAPSTNKLVVLDLTDPAHPSFVRTVSSTINNVRDFEISGGWAYIAGDRFGTLNLNSTSSTVNLTAAPSGTQDAVAVSGAYAFTSEHFNSDGRVHVYDVSNPGAPRYLSEQLPGVAANTIYTGLLAYGSSYLIGVSNGSSGWDVTVIDRRDINVLKRAGGLQIPGFVAWRGTLRGSLLYLVGTASNELVVVDLTDPTTPVVAGRLALPAGAGGIRALEDTTLIAATSAGAIATTVGPALLQVSGSASVGGNALDLVATAGFAYVANESGIVVVPVNVAPIVDASRITLSISGTMLTVTGVPRSITGQSAITVQVRDAATGAGIAVPLAGDGSFSASIPASGGDTITLTATDTQSRVTGPIPIGTAPFASSTQLFPIFIATDPSFRARNIKVLGNIAAVSSYPANSLGSNKIVLFDITDPANPVQTRVVPAVNNVRDFELAGNWAYIVGDRFGTLDLSNPASAIVLTGDPSGTEDAVAVVGGYAFTAENFNSDGRIHVYDVTNPAAPRWISEQVPGVAPNTIYSDLIAYGTNDLIGISNGTSGWDVTIIDRRDVNALKRAGGLQIPAITAFRGKLIGTTLYLAGLEGGVAAVDVSNPANPTLLSSLDTPGQAYGVEASGATVMIADRSPGVTFLDNALTLHAIGTQPVTGDAWDAALGGTNLYVAAELGLAVVQNVTAPPRISTSLIAVRADGTVAGAATAVTGQAPISVEVKNTRTSASVSIIAASDGSFSALVPASAGDTMTVKATDAYGRVAGPLVAGTVPFGSAARTIPIVISGDPNFRARAVKVEGTTAVVSSYPAYGTSSNKIVLFDITDPANPVPTRVVPAVNNVRDFELAGNWAYIVGDRFGTLDLSNPASAIVLPADTSGSEDAVAVVGGYAFTAENFNSDGRIHVYDVSNPAAPRWISEQVPGVAANTIYSDLIAYGTNYLIGISNGTSGWDVTIIDRRDVNALKRAGGLQIPAITAFRGKLIGTTLYLAGLEGGVAAVDVSDPANPTLLSSVDTPGQAYGVEASGAAVMIADRSPGVTFLDNASTLHAIGTQPVAGDAWDAALGGTNLYVAAELGLAVVQNVTAPPRISTSLIAVHADGTIAGAATAVTGQAPITVEVKNTRTSASVLITAAGDGSFSALVPASAGDTMTVKATDTYGRVAGPLVAGTVPFGSAARTIPIVISGDPNFRARAVKVEGTTAVVSSYPAYGTSSNKIVLFDITDPANPIQTRVVPAVNNVRDFELAGNWAYIVGDRFGTLDLSNPASTIVLTTDPSGSEDAVAVVGGYAFTAENFNTDGRIHVYDVSNPAAPRWISEQVPGVAANTVYSDLIAYGTNDLIGISNGTSGWDVTIIDRRDVNALKRVGGLQIPAITAFRGKLIGTTLYLAGLEGGVAAVDVSNPANPTLLSSLDTPGQAYGVEVSGTTAMVADRGVGVTFLDNSATLSQTGSQFLGGDAWDVALAGTTLYVASEEGLALVQDVVAPPDIVPSLITTSSTGSITGAPRAVVGQPPVQIVVTAQLGGTSGSVTVAPGGAFTASVAARGGETLTLRATDGLGRMNTKPIGAVPFFTTSTDQRGTRDDDTNYFTRRIAADGTTIVTSNGTQYGNRPSGSSKVTLFKQPNATDPPAIAMVDSAGGQVNDLDLRGGYAYVAGDRFTVIDYASATPARYQATSVPSGRDYSVALSGNFAFTGEGDWNHNGGIRVYDVSTPTAPVYQSTVATLPGAGVDFRKLIVSGTILYAISPDSNRDVTVIDISTPATPVRVTDFDVPSFAAFTGVLDGTTLYLAGGAGGIAIIDVSSPAPQLRSVIRTNGIAQDIAASATNEIVVADSSAGLTFIDTTDKTLPVILGSQPLQGSASGVKVAGGQIYVATQTRYYVLKRP